MILSLEILVSTGLDEVNDFLGVKKFLLENYDKFIGVDLFGEWINMDRFFDSKEFMKNLFAYFEKKDQLRM